MFEELKKGILNELKKRVIDLKREEGELAYELEEASRKQKEYYTYESSPTTEKRFIYFMEDYSKLSKIFNRNKYKNELKRVYEEIQEEYLEKNNDIKKRIDEIKARTQDIKKEANDLIGNVQKLETVKDMSKLSISFEKAKEILSKNNIDIYQYSCRDILSLGQSNETTGNLTFMQKAIHEDPFNIIYDQTLDCDMYYEFIKGLNYTIKNNGASELQKQEYFKENKEGILKLLEKSKSGAIFIKPTHILEAIRFYFKDSNMYENGMLVDEKDRDIAGACSNIFNVIIKALELSETDYLALLKMYHPDENNYYCHRTGSVGVEDVIFKNGLKISSQGIGERLIVKNARRVDCLLAIAGYCNFYAGNGAGDARIILEIPKDCERPIGSNRSDGKETYVLPEYVLASLNDANHDGKSYLHINRHSDRAKYMYLYEDGYSIGDGSAVLNPDFTDDTEKGINR